MASSSKPKKIYDVFLSFRGKDVRHNFVGHLYQALRRIGIYTFRDSEELKKGHNISMLMKAIEESCIAIVVFSENYASSQWCLTEVAKIMACEEQKDITVLPVFYKVDPNEVRGGRKSYRIAMAKHESKFGEDSEKVKRWKEALLNAGNLSGWHLNDGDDESKLIQEIVEEISTHLGQTPLHVVEHPVGIDSQVVKLKSMLNLESKDDVLMVGLWGQGGIGKTTLGKAIYNNISKQFEGSSFLANVRENSKDRNGLATLQEKLLNDILLPKEKLVVSDVARGINLIQHRLGHKRVLVILDDVDHLNQLHALAGKANWFGNGSRILVTTRDSHLLTPRIDKYHMYEVKALDIIEAHELFNKHAFPPHQKLKIREDLVYGVLDHAKGLPLALEVLGSFLCGRRQDEWESALDNLSRIPNKDINDVLKISYDGLEANEKEIFLHIACFFKGWEIGHIMKVLDNCGLKAMIGLQILTERSLIRIETGNIQVHDLIQMMGKDIVNQESDDPERRSRLWLYEDVLDVLSCDMGNCDVKAIVLKPPVRIKICASPDAFTKMRRLRLLILHNVSFQSLVCLPNEVRWLEWPDAPWYPEFSSGPKKLVGLEMPGGRMTFVPKPSKGFQNLKYLNFSGCVALVCMPDISCTPNLEELDLHNCKNLIEAHESIAYHDKLQVLNLRECSELSVFPNVLKTKNLRALNLERCTKFERFPDIPHKLKSLEKIYLQETAIKGLPASIENLVSLVEMYLHECKNLVSLPSSIYKLQKLKNLELWGCKNFIEFPRYKDSVDLLIETGLSNLGRLNFWGCNLSDAEFLDNPSCFPFLTELNLSGNNITSLPTSINKLDHLSYLHVENCHQLQEIPEPPQFLCTLGAEGCQSLQNYGDLTSVHYFVRRALNMADISLLGQSPPYYSIFLPGGEMPEWIVPVEEDSISFMVSQDLYDKFLGFAVFVCYADELEWDDEYRVVAHVNGEMRDIKTFHCSHCSSGLDHIMLHYLIPSEQWGVVDFSLIDGSHAQFSLEVSGEPVKMWGIRIMCKQLNDDLRVVLQDNRLINPALIYEVGHESTDSEAKSSLMHKDSSIETDIQKNSEDCLMSTEKHSQIGSKRDQKLILPQGKKPRLC